MFKYAELIKHAEPYTAKQTAALDNLADAMDDWDTSDQAMQNITNFGYNFASRLPSALPRLAGTFTTAGKNIVNGLAGLGSLAISPFRKGPWTYKEVLDTSRPNTFQRMGQRIDAKVAQPIKDWIGRHDVIGNRLGSNANVKGTSYMGGYSRDTQKPLVGGYTGSDMMRVLEDAGTEAVAGLGVNKALDWVGKHIPRMSYGENTGLFRRQTEAGARRQINNLPGAKKYNKAYYVESYPELDYARHMPTPAFKTNADLYEHYVDPSKIRNVAKSGSHIWTSPTNADVGSRASSLFGGQSDRVVREIFDRSGMQTYPTGEVLLNYDSPMYKWFPDEINLDRYTHGLYHNGNIDGRLLLADAQGFKPGMLPEYNTGLLEATADTGSKLENSRRAIQTGRYVFTRPGDTQIVDDLMSGGAKLRELNSPQITGGQVIGAKAGSK